MQEKINIFYKIRLVENLFFLYKFSYKGPTIKIIESGVAIDSFGQGTKKFNKVREKYKIDYRDIRAGSYSDLISMVYFQIKYQSEPFLVNDNLYKFIKELYIRFNNKEDQEEIRSKFSPEVVGVIINLNNFFAVNHCYQIVINSTDLEWVLPIYRQYGQDGINACCAYLEEKEPLNQYLTPSYINAINQIKNERKK
jgi:hypothetical protein